ncbi:glycosyltransferase [Faecalicatena contorta]|uniref:glycosyltransferase n=1 Tax=Faecalicatena contorta TaxID=39482 RepID=UPI001F1A47C6|nr:glycosyltransferase [Faecalicatena contorta]MCF2555884.1 glycosyltransferase family 4 protein [Faecalicatena contorta]
MGNKAKCIFHVPNYVNLSGTSGSQVRPIKMIQAFENLGYDVDIVMGYGKERKESIKRIKTKIKNGEKYDFLYSESSTMPTLLTEKNHLPCYPFLDFDFFNFCRKKAIKIGLFYRDIHWKFSHYRTKVPWYQKIITIPMYEYDLFQYKKCLDILYLPSKKVKAHLGNIEKNIKIDFLPPGATRKEIADRTKQYSTSKEFLHVFYVGGVTGIYDFEYLLKVAKTRPFIKLIVCCRENEWNEVRDKYQKYLTERVEIIHKSGKELEKYYEAADICSCYFNPNIYMSMAIPIKLLEYMSYEVPVLVTQGTEAGEFVEKNECGFSIPYDENALEELFDTLYNDQQLLLDKYINIKKCVKENTWEKRAEKVIRDLVNE